MEFRTQALSNLEGPEVAGGRDTSLCGTPLALRRRHTWKTRWVEVAPVTHLGILPNRPYLP